MIFILVTDVLGYMIMKVVEEELLQPLARRALEHRVSLYVDDVVLFLRPDANDIAITKDILYLFGEASGLRTNLQKSNVYLSDVVIKSYNWCKSFYLVQPLISLASI
jgi:hypothetical protein